VTDNIEKIKMEKNILILVQFVQDMVGYRAIACIEDLSVFERQIIDFEIGAENDNTEIKKIFNKMIPISKLPGENPENLDELIIQFTAAMKCHSVQNKTNSYSCYKVFMIVNVDNDKETIAVTSPLWNKDELLEEFDQFMDTSGLVSKWEKLTW
jgi:hypothetical protein